MSKNQKGMHECGICGRAFPLLPTRRYVARSKFSWGLGRLFREEEVETWDAWDCPWCGCQNRVNERRMPYRASEEAAE